MEQESEQLQKLVDSLAKIEIVAQSMKMTLSLGEKMSANDWARMGYMTGQLTSSADNLAMDIIGVTHDLYNPIPGKKRS